MPKKEWWKKATVWAALGTGGTLVAALANWTEIGVNMNKDRKDNQKKLAIN